MAGCRNPLSRLLLLAAPSAALAFSSLSSSTFPCYSIRRALDLRGGFARDFGMQIHSPAKDKVAAITFDLDDTLYECLPVIMKATKAQFDYVEEHFPNVKTNLEDFRAEMKRQKELHPETAADLGKLRRMTIAHVAGAAGYDGNEVADAVMEVFCRERNKVELFSDVPGTMNSLKASGLVLGGITNGNADFKETALKDHLEFCVSAGALGKPKPAKEPFLAALELCGVDASNAIHVGDDIVSDVVGAHSVGMRTVWYNPKQKPVPEEHRDKVDATITEISELEKVLAAWTR